MKLITMCVCIIEKAPFCGILSRFSVALCIIIATDKLRLYKHMVGLFFQVCHHLEMIFNILDYVYNS